MHKNKFINKGFWFGLAFGLLSSITQIILMAGNSSIDIGSWWMLLFVPIGAVSIFHFQFQFQLLNTVLGLIFIILMPTLFFSFWHIFSKNFQKKTYRKLIQFLGFVLYISANLFALYLALKASGSG